MSQKKRSTVTPQFLKTSDAATFLGLSRRYLHQLTQEGRIPYHRISPRCLLFRISDLVDFAESCRIGGESDE